VRNKTIHIKFTVFWILLLIAGNLFPEELVEDTVPLQIQKVREEIAQIKIISEETQGRYLSPLIMSSDYTEPVSNKMSKAKFYYNNKDYISSGSIYYSIVMSMQEKNAVWEEALFFLAESLYHNRNYISSTRYYEMLVTGMPESKYRFDCLKRLIASSYRLGNYSEAKNYYSLFIDAGYDISKEPDLAYYLAKSMFFDDYIKEAFNVFSTIKPENTYYLQSRYFLGVIELRQNNPDVALGYFESILQAEKKDAYYSFETIRELAMLAAARLAFESGDLMRAVRHYLNLDKRSPYFAEAYYELCWTYIRREEYQKAIDALRLIKFIEPDSIVVPKAEILEGSLLIKLERYGEAMILFNAIVERYGKIKDELFSLDSKSLTAGKSSENRALAPFSPLVRSLLRDNRKYTNAISLYDDISDLEKEIERTEKLERKLGSIIINEHVSTVFPPLKEGSSRALSLQNRLASLRDNLMEIRKGILWQDVSESKRARFYELEKEKERVSATISDIPLTPDQLEEKAAEYARKIIGMEEELHRITIQVKTFHHQLDGINSYFLKHSHSETDPRLAERIEREKDEINKIINELNSYKDAVENEKNRLVLGGDMVSRVVLSRNNLNRILAEQQEILSSVKNVSPYNDDIDGLLKDISLLEKSLDSFYAQLNNVVTEIVNKIRTSYENEKNNLNEYKSELYTIKREVTEMASLAMYSNINRVRSTFSDIVLKADLGIIDVAWEKKDGATDEILRLRIQRAQEIRALYSELEKAE